MFKVNHLNITLWILISILILILFAIIIWRIATKNKSKNNDFKQSKLTVANQLIDLSRSLQQVYEISSLVNILFKNRFAKNKFSLITLLSFWKNNAYLILNPLKIDVDGKIKINQNQIDYQWKNKNQKFDLKPIHEILRFFKSINLNVQIIIPSECKSQNQKFLFKPIEEIGDYIKDDKSVINKNSIANQILKIKKINLFKNKTTKWGTNV